MKRILFSLVLVALCAGCTTRYNITFTNGDVVTALGRPKFDRAKAGYFFKNAEGDTEFAFVTRVREISPASMSTKSRSFNVNDFR